MMAVSRPQKSISELFLESDVLDQLRQRFSFIQENLSTTIHEAAELTNLSEAQLRYAESRGMLAPNRAGILDADGGKGQRKYSVTNLLRAHLIAFLLDQGYSFSEINAFMSQHPAVIQDVLQTSTVRLKTATDTIDAIQYSRFVIPRMIYYALSLIFERDAVANAGIVVPVRADPEQLEQIDMQEVYPDGAEDGEASDITPDELGPLGQILLAWRPESRPLITILTAGNPFEREQRVVLRPLAKLLPPETPNVRFKALSRIFIAFEPQVERELDEATRTFNLRQSRGENYVNPRVVAARLISQAQRIFGKRMARARDNHLAMAKTQLYAAPEFINPAFGDALLNQLAETLVDLGGSHGNEPTRNRWRFACVMTPRDPYVPLKYQELVVRAQSSASPHLINVTTTAHEKNGGLTFRAFSSGRMVYREELTPLDPAVSYVEIEKPVKSAVAVPTLEGTGGGHLQPPAILYITSEFPNAFESEDFLLMRVMGRIVGEIVLTYNSRGHRPTMLTDALVKPEIVDPFFADFPSDSDFTSDLTKIYKDVGQQVPQEKKRKAESATSHPSQKLIIVGLDINSYTIIEAQRGIQIARILTRELGMRAKQRLESSFSRVGVTAMLYHSYADRFVMLIHDERSDSAAFDACVSVERIRHELSGEYYLEGDNLISVRSRPSTQGSAAIPMSVRMAVMTFEQDELERQLREARREPFVCVADISRMIDDGLRQANEMSGQTLWWDVGGHHWKPLANVLNTPERASSTFIAFSDETVEEDWRLDASDPGASQ